MHGLPVVGTVNAQQLCRFVPRPGTILANEQMEIEMNQVGAPDEVMEGLYFEEEDDDRDEGDVEDVDLGEKEFDDKVVVCAGTVRSTEGGIWTSRAGSGLK